jgi:hypothetical protein
MMTLESLNQTSVGALLELLSEEERDKAKGKVSYKKKESGPGFSKLITSNFWFRVVGVHL